MSQESAPARFKSHAQRRRMQALVDEGKFPQAEFDALHAASGDDLPERATSGRHASRNPSDGRKPIGTRLPPGPESRYARAGKARLY